MTLIFVSVFQLICVSLSKADAKLLLYNICSKLSKHFFGYFLHLLHKLLILNHAEKPRVPGLSCGSEPPIYLIIIISTIALEEDKFYRENDRKKKIKNEKVGISPFTAFTLQRNYEGWRLWRVKFQLFKNKKTAVFQKLMANFPKKMANNRMHTPHNHPSFKTRTTNKNSISIVFLWNNPFNIWFIL